MTTTTDAQIPADAMEQTVSLVFEVSLAQEVDFLGQVPGPEDASVAGCVEITGVGRVLLSASEPAARRLASRLLDVEADGLSGDDVRDALGEVTNMIAGNFKSAFLPGHQLVAPAFAIEADSPAAAAGEWWSFAAEDGEFRVAFQRSQT